MKWRRPAPGIGLAGADVDHDGWVEVGRMSDLADNRMTVEVNGVSVLIVRCGRSLVAVENECPHLARPLSGGRVTGRVIQCPGHGYRWNLVSGKALSRAAGRRPLLRIPIRVTGDQVSVARLPVRR
jgi:nitrite reductase/ring-hydroxylating ferredoxin subunit